MPQTVTSAQADQAAADPKGNLRRKQPRLIEAEGISNWRTTIRERPIADPLRRVLVRKGVLTNDEVLEEVKAVRREMEARRGR